MSAAEKWHLISEEDYLKEELSAPGKREYLAGVVHAMAGAPNRHNDIALNCLASLHARLKGGPCKPCNSDTKARVRLATGTRYYYPDAMVVCRPNPDEDSFQDEPSAIIEVLSDSTRRTDLSEKKEAYLTIPSLGAYVLLETDAPLAIVFRRTATGFEREVVEGLEAAIAIPGAAIDLPLAEVYQGIRFDQRNA